jgi:serine/threonine-protein kinase
MSAPEHPKAASRVGNVLDGRFRLEKMLGSGAMGAVFVATASNGHSYAIKLLLDESYARHPELIARFVREGRLAASLDAINVGKVYELGIDQPTMTPFIVMELLDGSDVDGLVAQVGPVHPQAAAKIISQAARGLAAAHAAGIVHRDIKPANLFIHRRSAEPTAGRGREVSVKVVDFGVAKAILAEAGHDSMTATGSLLGSPLYMSPEQIKSAKHVDARSDVWSLGMTLWTLLAGRAALNDVTSLSDLFITLGTKQMPWIQDFAPWVDPALARVLHGTLLRELPARCPTMEALIEALEPFATADDALCEAELIGAPAPLRVTAAPRATAATSWSESVPTRGGAPKAEAVDPALQALVGATLAGRYRLDRVLGIGGMGAVYQATAANGSKVAVKVILGDPDKQRPEMLKRFVREAKSTMAIDSPNVVQIVDVDADPQRGFPFIVMELLSGTDLDRLVKQNGALEPEPVIRVFLQACAGLQAAHARSIVHRDIKPANIFLHTDQAGRVRVKICDFGIAKQVASEGADQAATELTRTGGMLGSPMYMSPEQARSAKHVDQTTDVWSLGIALYEALSGRRPWDKSTTVGELIIAICTEQVPPLQDIAPWIEPGLADVVHHALQRDATARYPSMEAFAAALAPYAGRSNDILLASSLTTVSTERKSIVAPRGTFGGTTAPLAAGGSTTTASNERRRGPGLVIAATLGVVALVGGVVFLAVGRGDGGSRAKADVTPAATAAPAVASTPATEASAATPARIKAKVAISPKDATVTVDGASVAIPDGVLELEGEPGDRFEVVAKAGTKTKRETVLIGKDGKCSIAAIDVTNDKTKPTVPGAATATAKATAPGAAIAPTATAPATATATATATAAPPPATTPPPPPQPTTPVGASTF